jgi:hypothetical protein
MGNLTPEVRHKAIDIANALVREDKYEEGRAIAIATAQAEKWAKHRDKRVHKKGAEGSTGHTLEKDEIQKPTIPSMSFPVPMEMAGLPARKRSAWLRGRRKVTSSGKPGIKLKIRGLSCVSTTRAARLRTRKTIPSATYRPLMLTFRSLSR